MLVQKTFHLHMAHEMAKAKLSNLEGYRRHLIKVQTAALMTDGLAHFEFRLPFGFQVKVALGEVLGRNPAQTLFRSRNGNVEVLGMLEYFQIKPDLTEVVLTLDYTICHPVHRLLDYFWHGVDRFLNLQLEQIEIHFAPKPVAGIRTDRTLPLPINGCKKPALPGAE